MRKELYRSQFRLPWELYEQMKTSADTNQRSVNAELVARLEESFRPQPSGAGIQPSSDTTVRLLSEMYEQTMERVAALKAQKQLTALEHAELQHEEETAKHLRHAAARAAAAEFSRSAQ